MKYEAKARPIETAEALDAAIAAGARVEYTACRDFPGDPDTYDMPQRSGGWIDSRALDAHRDWLRRGEWMCPKVHGLRGLRAFYPLTAELAA